MDRLRQALYDPQNAATVPFVIERAYDGDYIPMGELVDGMSQALARALNWGAFLSYTCADEMPFISEREVRIAAYASFAGDARFRAQQRACSIWNVASMPPSFDDAVRSELPILLISGSDDPTTPPRFATEARGFLPNARQVIVAGAGHTTETPCVDALIVQFVRAGSAKHLNVSRCSAAFTPPPFATSDK
ncbi:MAG: alpha/beta hydrolase [Candidatus Cybelea sp.]